MDKCFKINKHTPQQLYRNSRIHTVASLEVVPVVPGNHSFFWDCEEKADSMGNLRSRNH